MSNTALNRTCEKSCAGRLSSTLNRKEKDNATRTNRQANHKNSKAHQRECPSPPTVSDTIYKKPEHIFDIKQIQEVSNHMGFFLGLLQSVTVITRPKERDQFVVAASVLQRKKKK